MAVNSKIRTHLKFNILQQQQKEQNWIIKGENITVGNNVQRSNNNVSWSEKTSLKNILRQEMGKKVFFLMHYMCAWVWVLFVWKNEWASERCAFPLKLITITYQSLIFVRCLLIRTQWTGVLCTIQCCWCAVFGNGMKDDEMHRFVKPFIFILTTQRHFYAIDGRVGFAEEPMAVNTMRARFRDKMIRMQRQLTSFHFGSDSERTKRKSIFSAALIQWIKLNIYWNSFSQRIHHQTPFTHVHLALIKYISAVHSGDRDWLPDLFFFIDSVPPSLALCRLLFFIIILPSCQCS